MYSHLYSSVREEVEYPGDVAHKAKKSNNTHREKTDNEREAVLLNPQNLKGRWPSQAAQEGAQARARMSAMQKEGKEDVKN